MGNEFREIATAMLAILREKTPAAIFDIWYRDLELVKIEGNVAMFSIPSKFKCDYLTQNYAPNVKEALSMVLGADVEVNFAIRALPSQVTYVPPEIPSFKPDPPILPHEEGDDEPPQINTDEIENPRTIVDRYTFDNFIVADSNRFAYAAARAVAKFACSENEEFENVFNPLFIYGKSGLGKTHLLYAITNEIKKKNPSVRIIYKKGEDFTTEFLSALENNSQASFRAYYRKADLLLIDDIQFIAGKEQTQVEFFHTFSALYEAGKQVILTSDRPPREINNLTDRLMTRFEWGQLADIQPPSAELRTAIIRKKATEMGLSLPADVVEFLSDNMTENIRQIEGAINRIKGVFSINSLPITLDGVRRAVADFIHSNTSVSDTMSKIFRAGATRYRVTPDEIKGKSRKESIATARHISIYLATQLTDLSQSAIGAYYDRDHTTVGHSIRKVEKNIHSDPNFAYEIEELIREIRA